MTVRLGDGVDGRTETLGGGPFDGESSSLGAKGNLFLGLRPARRELNQLVGQAALVAPVLSGVDPIGGGSPGTGGSGGPGSGDGPGGPGDGPGGPGDGPGADGGGDG